MIHEYLRCLKDGSELDADLKSSSSGIQYRRIDGAPRFVVSDCLPDDYNTMIQELDPYSKYIRKVQKAFNFQWKKFAQGEDAYGFTVDYVKKAFEWTNPEFDFDKPGQKVLDCGCGGGASVEMFNRHGMYTMGLELTEQGVAATNNRSKDLPTFIGVVQGNILNSPVAKEKFDFAYANGMIQTVVDPGRAMRNIASCVKPGGQMQIVVYRNLGSLYTWFDNTFRNVFYGIIPLRAFFYVSFVLAPFLTIFFRPHFETDLTFKKRVEFWYDWISPRYQHYYTQEELEAEFRDMGFTDLHTTSTKHSWNTVGRKK